ncbi:MAG: type III-A CRISPR-associated protein Cas10/Csm1, partial [Spirochaetota bacterium]|nr:type III-A CRISPR-associated protein Cas10/Csm1 [Spirochaetota bacterium]
YIFDLHSTKNASKLLRARSFELQALSENISDSLLERFQLPHFCRIINAGGKFTVLLPNIPQVQDELQKFRKELDHYFIQKYHGQITFNLSEGVEACGRDFDQSKSISLFRSISLDSARAKQKKLQTVLMSQADHVLDKDYDKIQETAGICDQCRERPGFHEIDETLFCHSCKDLFQFGGELPKAKFMRISQNKTKNALNLFDGKILEVLREKTSSEDSLVSLHNYHSGLALKHSSSYIPSEGNKILTMEEIGARSTGMDHIAMFKADLDNLGGIFSIGMKEKTSLSRYSSMSRMLNYFFSDYLHHMIEKSEKYKDIYIVFSGGDDLCLIGPWNIVIDFAAEFQKEFERFVGKNPNLTISGGIALASNKLPVKSLAQMTEELLDKSKDKDMKNSITLFGKTISWIRLRELLKESDKLMTQVFRNQKNSKEGLSKGLVYRLLNYSKKAQAMTDGDFRGDIPLWKSHLSYDISRNVYEEELRKELLSQLTKEEVINDMPVAVSHVLYQLRDRKNGGHKNED